LGSVVACLLAATQPTACGSNDGNVPPVNNGDNGGGFDAAPDQGGTHDGGSTTDGSSMGDAKHEAGDGAAHDGPGGDGAGLDASMEVGLIADAPSAAPDGGVLCAQGETWGSAVNVYTTSSAVDATIFGAVTPDELTLAWASSTGGVVTAWYVDRTSTSVAFGAPQQLASTFGALLLDRVSLSGDGLRIVGVSSATTGFVAAKRAARMGPFNTDDSAEFAGLAAEGAKPTFATPLLAPDDSQFFYIVTNATTADVIDESVGPPWGPGAFLSTTRLQKVGTQYRRPSGMSGDDLSLFYWDETTSSEVIAFRQNPSTDFNVFVDIGARKYAVPTANCARIYYSTPAGNGITIVYADGTKPDN
jgi:hypothetical protein